MLSRAAALLALALAWAVLGRATASAQGDYVPTSREWNGLSEFLERGRSAGHEIASPAVIDLGTLRPADGLLIVHPTVAPPVDSLAAFVNAGGRLVVADDFGAAESLLARFAIHRRPIVSTDAPRVRGHEGLIVARTHFRHPLTEGVDMLVTNHPAVVRHDHLEPLVAFDRSGGGVLLTGVVGSGRLVVLSDPSVLINHMRVFRGNERFAANLLDVLAGPARGRVFVATEHTRFTGTFGSDTSDPLRVRVDRLLQKLASMDLPKDAMRVANTTLAALVLLLASATWRAQRAYRFPWPDAVPDARRRREIEAEARASAALTLHDELVRNLESSLGVGRDALAVTLRSTLVARGFSPTAAGRAERLLATLAAIDASWHSGASPRVSERELARLSEAAGPLLARLVVGPSPA